MVPRGIDTDVWCTTCGPSIVPITTSPRPPPFPSYWREGIIIVFSLEKVSCPGEGTAVRCWARRCCSLVQGRGRCFFWLERPTVPSSSQDYSECWSVTRSVGSAFPDGTGSSGRESPGIGPVTWASDDSISAFSAVSICWIVEMSLVLVSRVY